MAKRGVTRRKKGKRKATRARGKRKNKRYPLSATSRAWVVARDRKGHLTGIKSISPTAAKAHIGG